MCDREDLDSSSARARLLEFLSSFAKESRESTTSYALGLLMPAVRKQGLKTLVTRGHCTATGVRVLLPNDWSLSVQTDADVCGEALAETALMHAGRLVYEEQLGYDDIVRFYSPEKFEAQLAKVLAFANQHARPSRAASPELDELNP